MQENAATEGEQRRVEKPPSIVSSSIPLVWRWKR